MKKVLITATVQSHICQFHKPLVHMLHRHGYEVHVAAKNNLAEKNGMQLDFADKVFDVPFSRSPKSLDNVKAYGQLKEIIAAEGYDIIHCNTPMGGIVTRLAARSARKNGTKVYYTAHGFHFYQGASLTNWLIYYPIEKFMARMTDKLITICKEDYNTATLKNFKTKVCYMHGVGANSTRYTPAEKSEKAVLREKFSVPQEAFVLLCTGELNDNKNQKTVVSAFAEAVKTCPNMMLLLAGNGPRAEKIREQVLKCGVEDKVCLLGYQMELENYMKLADAAVSASYREGLPLNVMEAMLCKKPVIVSDNRGHRELVHNAENGFVLQAEDVQGFAEQMRVLYTDAALCQSLGERGYVYVQPFCDTNIRSELEEIYEIV